MNTDKTADRNLWPDVNVARWVETKRSFHLYAQMLGKTRLALSPVEPNWMFTPLYLNARGLTTGVIPLDSRSLEARIDVFASEIQLDRSTGERVSIPLVPAQTIRHVYRELQAALDALSAPCVISPIPQELRDLTPFHADDRPAVYDPEAVGRWFRAATSSAGVFADWRSHFFGRSGLQVWWGALDLALILFNGKKVVPPQDRGYIMKYDLDAELMNVGLYYGDAETQPFFYGYIFPEPANAATLPIAPTHVRWSDTLHEWVLPYDAVRNAHNPAAELRTFLDAIYEQCISAANWEREALSYIRPIRQS
jgi:hypothetical protein